MRSRFISQMPPLPMRLWPASAAAIGSRRSRAHSPSETICRRRGAMPLAMTPLAITFPDEAALVRRVDLVERAGLADAAFVAALLYAVSDFGFAVLATPVFLLFGRAGAGNSARHHH